MDIYAVPQRRTRLGLAAIATLAAALSVACLATPSSAAPFVGKDGKVHACVKVRGKARGTVRLVSAAARCKRGERKAAWSAAGPTGAAGQAGAKGDTGAPGPSGLPGEEVLKTQVTELTKEVEVLQAKLSGITALDLQKAVAAAADVEALCGQASVLTTRANEIGTALTKFALGGTIPLLLELVAPKPLTELSAFTC